MIRMCEVTSLRLRGTAPNSLYSILPFRSYILQVFEGSTSRCPYCSNCCRSSRWISIGSHNGQGPPASPSFVLPRAMFVHEVRATCLTATTPCGVSKSFLSRMRQPWVRAFLCKRKKLLCPSFYRGSRKASDIQWLGGAIHCSSPPVHSQWSKTTNNQHPMVLITASSPR